MINYQTSDTTFSVTFSAFKINCERLINSAAITSVFASVPASYWDSVRDSPLNKQAIYAVGVTLGILRARQAFGSRGLSQSYPLGGAALRQAVDALVQMCGAESHPKLEDMCRMLDWVS